MTPRWLDRPEAPTTLPHLPLTRIRPGVATVLMLTSSKLLGVPTHYMSRRTLPCVDDACPGCELKLPRRPEWYTGALTREDHKHILVALTPAVAWQIYDAARDRPSLRNLVCVLSRAGRAANSRLLVQIREPTAIPTHFPDEPDLVAHLLHIWGLDQGHLGQDDAAYVNRVKDYYRRNGHATDVPEAG